MVNGKKIASLRQNRGWDQKELAAIVGVVPSVISRLESEAQSDYKLSVVARVARALGVSVDSLLDGTQQDSVIQLLIPELQEVIQHVASKSVSAQRQVAGILRGYLSTIE